MAKLIGEYRDRACKAVEKAKKKLASPFEDDWRYAALDLREAIEAITYVRVEAFKEELPPKAYQQWQPKKLMQSILEIDPKANFDVTLNMRTEGQNGQPDSEWMYIGTEKILNIETIKKHYDALGSYLHVQTPKQIEKEFERDNQKIKERCEKIVEALEPIVKAGLITSRFGWQLDTACRFCGSGMRRKLPTTEKITKVKCFECEGEHEVETNDEGHFLKPLADKVDCPTEGCGKPIYLGKHEQKPSNNWKCSGCGSRYGLALFLVKLDETTRTPILASASGK